ncbi:hypothetical protein LUZ60_002033 [Juncus effusus]|nr:hypothetical protein LUZ60_002033 [Juncus effusus]
MENSPPNQNRMPRWTKSEILVLIKSKRHVETPGGCYVSTRGRPITSSAAASPGQAAPPKWLAVSSACAEQGVQRGPTQCRKRWGNLSAAFRKIKEYEGYRKHVEKEEGGDGNREYWKMEMEERKRKGLPGRFDRAVFQAMDGDDVVDRVQEREDDVEMESDEEALKGGADVAGMGPALSPIPISMRRFEPFQDGSSDPEMESEKQPEETSDKSSPQKEGLKRKRSHSFHTEEKEIRSTEKLIQTLERGTRLIAAQLDANNIQAQLDRDLRRQEMDKLLKVFNRIADSVEKIARKFE